MKLRAHWRGPPTPFVRAISNRSDGNGRYTLDQQKAHARYLHVCARLRGFSLGGRTAAGADCELLGSDWQCTKTAFVLTTCTLFPQPYTEAAQNQHDDKVAARTDAP